MSSRIWISSMVGVAAVAALGALTQYEKPGSTPVAAPSKHAGKQAPKEVSPEDSMAAWAQYANPGPHHKHLEPMVGTWNAVCKFWMEGPDAPPTASTGTATNKWDLGGRFIHTEFHGQFMDQPFEGVGYMGYDNATKKYVGTWMDTMMTGVLSHTGSCDAAGKVFTMSGSFFDPSTNSTVKDRNVTTIKDNNTVTYEMFHTVDNQETKVGEITYTRTR